MQEEVRRVYHIDSDGDPLPELVESSSEAGDPRPRFQGESSSEDGSDEGEEANAAMDYNAYQALRERQRGQMDEDSPTTSGGAVDIEYTDSESSVEDSGAPLDKQLLRLLEKTATGLGMTRERVTEEDTEPDDNLFWDEMTVFSETSHEDGKDFREAISDADSEPDAEGVFLANSQVRQATKQQMRAADVTFDDLQDVVGKHGPQTCKVASPTEPRQSRTKWTRRPGPFRCLEICTWTCAITLAAVSMGWEGL